MDAYKFNCNDFGGGFLSDLLRLTLTFVIMGPDNITKRRSIIVSADNL